MVTQYVALLEANGALESVLPPTWTVESYTEYMITMMNRLIPGAFLISSMVLTWILYFSCCMVLKRLGYAVRSMPKFADWRMDWRLVWGLIIGLACNWCGQMFGYDWMITFGVNLTYIFGPLIFICGVAFIYWAFKNLEILMPIKVLIVAFLVCFSSIGILIVLFLAVIDAVKDIRTPLKEKSGKQKQYPY